MHSSEDILLWYPIHDLNGVKIISQQKKLFVKDFNPTFYNSTIDYKHVIVDGTNQALIL